MYPVVYQRALSLLQQGERLTKYDLAAKAPCHVRTAQRILKKICEEEQVFISGWVLNKNAWIPRYKFGTSRNQTKPRALTGAERVRKLRKNPEYRAFEAMRARARRLRNGAFKSKAKREMFNLIVMRPE